MGSQEPAEWSRILCVLAIAILAAEAVASQSHHVTLDVRLSKETKWAYDVRWVDAQHVAISAGWEGTHVVELGGELRTSSSSLTDRECERLFSFELGVSPQMFVTAEPAYSMAWENRKTGACRKVKDASRLQQVFDLDVRDNRVVWLGSSRTQVGMCPDGAIAWSAELGDGVTKLTPVHFSQDGVGCQSIEQCGVMGVSAIRFLHDASIVVVPGVEPGVFHYSASGRLLTVWPSATFGLTTGCDFANATAYQRSYVLRQHAWVNKHRTVDDIVPQRGGFALLVRDVVDGQPQWSLVSLQEGGTRVIEALPLRGDSDLTHAKADELSDRLVILLSTYDDTGLTVTPRLVVLGR